MPLETTMICMDNSEYMRNGDYSPSRMESMQDAANLVSNAKMQSNPENTVGIMALAGRNPELLVSPTDDMGKIMNSIHEIRLFGALSFADGVQVAYLALKHRRNKMGGQRIVLLVGSPVEDDPKTLKKVAGILRKNGIAVDVVSIGEVEENQAKLEEFVKVVDKDNNSHLVTIPAGCVPADMLITSPVINEGVADGGGASMEGFGGAPAAAAAGGEFGGVDPNMDPELAMALRVSMEEERARQESEAVPAPAPLATAPEPLDAAPLATAPEPLDAAPAAAAPEPLDATPAATPAAAPVAADASSGGDEMDDEALLQQALALSMNDDAEGGGQLDEEMQQALSMSMALDAAEPPAEPAAAAAPSAAAEPPPAAAGAPVYDSSFVNGLLASLPGVDPSDPRIQLALQQIQAKQDEDKSKDSKK